MPTVQEQHAWGGGVQPAGVQPGRTWHDWEFQKLVPLLGLGVCCWLPGGGRRAVEVLVRRDLHRGTWRPRDSVHLHLLHQRRVLWEAAVPCLQHMHAH